MFIVRSVYDVWLCLNYAECAFFPNINRCSFSLITVLIGSAAEIGRCVFFLISFFVDEMDGVYSLGCGSFCC